ncbi:MAG: UPF0280 family protein [Alphaproteobacteria bacterium]
MQGGAEAQILPDGRRLHLNHGPIDLIVEAFGAGDEIHSSYRQASARFADILSVLAGEIDLLRRAVARPRVMPEGPVARRMMEAVWPHREVFVTPMAAVAGAVADEVLAAMISGRTLTRAYVNNGGDIAFHLTPGQSLTAGVVGDYHLPAIDSTARLSHESPVRGIATSGWKGRSHSLGIADAVTVLARDAAAADAAATLIANEVNADHPAIERIPAQGLDPDSDLGSQTVTVAVGELDPETVSTALNAGIAAAERLERAGLICAAVLVLQGELRVAGDGPNGLLARRAA